MKLYVKLLYEKINLMSRPVLIFMFSGQGSQHYQMGTGLFHRHLVFREWLFKLNNLVP